MSAALKWIEGVENQLATLYRLPLITSAAPFLMKADQIIKSGADVHPPRGAVFLSQTIDTLDIGLYIDPALLGILDDYDPNIKLDAHNLDAYCVLVEELSHFHLLLHRSQQDRGVSQLELEWQGEIDKLLLAGLLMSEQKKTSCFRELHRFIFEESQLSEDPMYQEASHYAAKCWHRLLPKNGQILDVQKHVLPTLQNAYKVSWPQKLRIIQNL